MSVATLEEKILRKLPEGWEEQMMDLYSQGADDNEVMSELRLHYDLFKRLMLDDHFREVVYMGRLDAKAFWNKKARLNLENKDFNAGLYKAVMENRYGWSTKTSHHEADEEFSKALNNDEIEQRISELTRKLRVVDKEEVKG